MYGVFLGGPGRTEGWLVDLATGAEVPGWPVSLGVRPKTDHVWGALNLFRGRLYAGISSYCNNAFYRGALMAIDVRRARLITRRRLTDAHRHGAGIWGWGGVAIDSANGRVYAATANVQSHPQDAKYAEHVLRFSPNLRLEAANRPHAYQVNASLERVQGDLRTALSPYRP